jgi:osmotically-inducible protein OsmY
MKKVIYLALLGVAFSQLHGCAAVVVGGAAVGASMVTDRRGVGVYVVDQEIETRASARLHEAFEDKPVRFDITSFNRQVLILGQVPDEESRAKAAEIVKAVPEVRTVFNELTVSGLPSFTSITNDGTISSTVKTRLWGDERAPGTKIKVKTEGGVVYLMGLVTKAEGDAAAELASTTKGVTKVVKLFEYID